MGFNSGFKGLTHKHRTLKWNIAICKGIFLPRIPDRTTVF